MGEESMMSWEEVNVVEESSGKVRLMRRMLCLFRLIQRKFGFGENGFERDSEMPVEHNCNNTA